MRVMLDVHPSIRCGPESHIIPKILAIRKQQDSPFQRSRLVEAHLYPTALDAATKAFISTVIKNGGSDADLLCNKDPFSLKWIDWLARVFGNAKFIHMVRDGRAVVASVIKYITHNTLCSPPLI